MQTQYAPATYEVKTCNTCCRIACAPFRVYDAFGKVVEGCVDAFHTGHLVTISESNRWHNRQEAKKIRKAMEVK